MKTNYLKNSKNSVLCGLISWILKIKKETLSVMRETLIGKTSITKKHFVKVGLSFMMLMFFNFTFGQAPSGSAPNKHITKSKSAYVIVSNSDNRGGDGNEYIYFRSGEEDDELWYYYAQLIVADESVKFQVPLEVLGGGRNNDPTINLEPQASGGGGWGRIGSEGQLAFFTGGRAKWSDQPDILINRNGKVIIVGSSTTPQISSATLKKYELFVELGILSENYGIGPQSTWADYVFQPNYSLKSLNEVEKYIEENNQLPDMFSQQEVSEEGYSLHEMNVKLLEKVEELTLYTIEQEKQLTTIKANNQVLLEKIKNIERKIFSKN